MNIVEEGDLAWALADSASGYLKAADHARLCAKIGAGEQGSAIRDLLGFYAHTNAQLSRELAAQVQAWITGYKGSDSEPALWRIYDRITVSRYPASRRRNGAETRLQPGRLIATRSAHAKRAATASKHSAPGAKAVAICGVSTNIEGLFEAANGARRDSRKAAEVAVREARSAGWSWARISAALGGTPNKEELQRRFGS